MNFLCDHGLRRVGTQAGRRHVQQHRQVHVFGAGCDGVAEADVHRDRDARAGQRRGGAQARSAVFEFFADCIDPQVLQVEVDPVVGFDRHDLSEGGEQGVFAGIPETQQIHIARGAVGFVEPGDQQHRAFQHEALTVWRQAQAVQQALQRIAGQQQVHRLASRMRQVQQALAHGGADVALVVRHRWSVP